MEPREPFLDLAPKGGWLGNYLEWTSGSESPAAFHYFVGSAVIGAALKRSTWFHKGYYKVYPNKQVLLVGPTGKVRKTSAISLGVNVLRKLTGINIISKKITPEAIIDALTEIGDPDKVKLVTPQQVPPPKVDSCAVIVATELAVFLGKQKYNEGMIALLTDLFDSPDEWSTQTRGRGKIELHNVGLTGMWASTPDWLITAIPHDAFGGGFMRRILFVVQESTPRCFPIPEAPPPVEHLVDQLREIQRDVKGQMFFSEDALEWYVTWYSASRGDIPEDEKMAGYHESKPDHMIREAMILAASEKRTTVELNDIKKSSMILDYLEKEMLYTFKWLGMRPVGQDQERIIRTLRANGSKMSHSDLLRRLIFFMNAMQFKNSMQTLIESRIVREIVTTTLHTYELLKDNG